jgi:hypothetical protein
MRFKQANFASLSSAKRRAVLVCLLLVGIAIVAQSFHFHPNDLANGAKHCAICHVAHAPVQVVSVVHVSLGLGTTVFFSFSSDPDPKLVLASFSLFSRPPPLV